MESLTQQVRPSFQRQDSKLDQLERKLERMTSDLEQFNLKLNMRFEEQLDQVLSGVDSLTSRISRLERAKSFKATDTKTNVMKSDTEENVQESVLEVLQNAETSALVDELLDTIVKAKNNVFISGVLIIIFLYYVFPADFYPPNIDFSSFM